jgi:hypothetical protein
VSVARQSRYGGLSSCGRPGRLAMNCRRTTDTYPSLDCGRVVAKDILGLFRPRRTDYSVFRNLPEARRRMLSAQRSSAKPAAPTEPTKTSSPMCLKSSATVRNPSGHRTTNKMPVMRRPFTWPFRMAKDYVET